MTVFNNTVTLARVNELLSYDPPTGIFRWTALGASFSDARWPGQRAGSLNPAGYRRITIDGCSRYAHRLAWLVVYGAWPSEQIDHINGQKDENWIANLREASHTENQRNRGLRSTNSTGITGVYRHGDRFRARILGRHLGLFLTIEEATLARRDAERLLFGSFQPTKS